MGLERRYSFDVDADYQTVYRRIVDVERRCYQGSMITANMMVNADLYTEMKRGEISVGLYGVIAQIHQVVDVSGLEDGRTSVTAIYPMGPVEKQGEKLRAWATGSATDC